MLQKYTKANLLPEEIKSATEEIYEIIDGHKNLLHKKEMVFTKNDRIKSSKTVDSGGNMLQTTEKKMVVYCAKISRQGCLNIINSHFKI